MINIKLMLAAFTLAALSLARAGQEPKPAEHPKPPPRLLDLPPPGRGGTVVLFERALVDEAGRCKVHRHRLEVATVPVVYGLMPGRDERYYRAERKKFPNAITSHEAGCLVMSAEEAKVLQCRECIRAKAAYEKRRGAASRAAPEKACARPDSASLSCESCP